MRQRGNSSVLVLIVVLVLLILGASAASYYVLKSAGRAPVYTDTSYVAPLQATTPPTNSTTISDNDDLDTLEAEMAQTSTGEIDGDMSNLNSSAASL